jgi:septal ring factor EnvC (AmiA/AmiB activator)
MTLDRDGDELNDAKRIAELLSTEALGSDNAIKSGEIVDRLNIDERDHDTNPRTRDLVKEVRTTYQLPVIGCDSGYFIPTSRQPVEDKLDEIRRRIEAKKQKIERKKKRYENFQRASMQTDGGLSPATAETDEQTQQTEQKEEKDEQTERELTEQEQQFLENNPITREELLKRRDR